MLSVDARVGFHFVLINLRSCHGNYQVVLTYQMCVGGNRDRFRDCGNSFKTVLLRPKPILLRQNVRVEREMLETKS